MWESFEDNVLSIWVAGGWLMLPLFILGLLIYYTIFEILVYLRRHNFAQANPDQWAHWVELPDQAEEGDLGDVILYAQFEADSPEDVRDRMDEVRNAHLPRLDGRIKFASIMVGTAPLAGLLGTVTGMLSTFAGLAISSGGNTIDLVAGGISEALITTQTGLVLAIPGYVLINAAKRQRDQMAMFFNQVEILTLKRFSQPQLPHKASA